MELVNFLENDIIEFLEDKAKSNKNKAPALRDDEKALFGERDYEREVLESLGKDDYAKSKMIEKSARREYGKLARDSPKRDSLDLMIKKITSLVSDYAKKKDIKEDKKAHELSMEHQTIKSSIKKKAEQTPKESFRPQNDEMMRSQSTGVSQGMYFLPFMNSPLNFDELSKKQTQEKILLDFKQNMELHAQKEYSKIEQEKEKIIKELISEIKKENKAHLDKLKNEVLDRVNKIKNSLKESIQENRVVERSDDKLEEVHKHVEKEVKKINQNLDKSTEIKPSSIQVKNIIQNPLPQPDSKIKESNQKYVDAVSALKRKEKAKALSLLIPLVKENPKNVAFKIRLKEALQLKNGR